MPADCVVLWQKRDVGLLTYFVEQLTDPEEKEHAWKRYHLIRDFVESNRCRHRQICSHFGENPKFEKCDACDACGSCLDWLADVQVAVARRPAPRVPVLPATVASRSERSSSFAKPVLSSVDPELREYLREWRSTEAKQQGVPAFVVMHDTSLDELCRKRPRSMSQLLEVPGFGEHKTEMYGQKIFDVFNRFRNGARASAESAFQTRASRRKKSRKSAGT
jgi:ATP-dependent DNA helicase RecQ